QPPPRPVMTIRGLAMSGFLLDQAAHGFDDVADIGKIGPGIDRAHFDLDAEFVFKVEYEFGQFQRMDAEFRQVRGQRNLACVGAGVRLDLFDDCRRQLVAHSATPKPDYARKRAKLLACASPRTCNLYKNPFALAQQVSLKTMPGDVRMARALLSFCGREPASNEPFTTSPRPGQAAT